MRPIRFPRWDRDNDTPWQVTAIILVVMVCLIVGNHFWHRYWPTPLSAEAEAARQMAIEKFDEINGVGRHLLYDIVVGEHPAMRELPGKWMVIFNKSRPDGVFTTKMVTIDKATGEMTYNPGQN